MSILSKKFKKIRSTILA